MPPRPPRWPLGHEASALPPRSSGERGGARGEWAGLLCGLAARPRADPRGQETPSLPHLIGSAAPSLLSLTRERSALRHEWAGPSVNQALCWVWSELRRLRRQL